MQEKLNKQKEVTGAVTIRSVTGASILTTKATITKATRARFMPDKKAVDQTCDELKKLGFKILAVGKFSVSIAGSQELFEKVLQAKLERRTMEVLRTGTKKMEAQFFEAVQPLKLPAKLTKLVEDIALAEPPILFESATPPQPSYFHLDVPHDIACLMRANLLHNIGVTGNKVKLAMVDTGFYDHPYYSDKGYKITRLAAVGNITQDEVGHGTGIATNALAVAPGVDFISVKESTLNSSDPLAAFQLAVAQNPDIITCSWGYDIDYPGVSRDDLTLYKLNLEAEIAAAVDDGIVVLFACGNGQRGWPAGMPEVIAVGGAYIDQYLSLKAASYASSFDSSIYPGRHCPDVCGLCGELPMGIYIVVPTQPNSHYDDLFSDGSFPNGDETAADDGWMVASGTSSATPMVAGAVALRLQRYPGRTPAQIKSDLQNTARDVTAGQSSMGDSAGPGWDAATGYGLVDANAAYWRWVLTFCPPFPGGCPPAPIIICPPNPTLCLRAPSICPPNPTLCLRAPSICPPNPTSCPPSPDIVCPSSPSVQCPPSPGPQCPPGPVTYTEGTPKGELKPEVKKKEKGGKRGRSENRG
jgi:serine protease AprX